MLGFEEDKVDDVQRYDKAWRISSPIFTIPVYPDNTLKLPWPFCDPALSFVRIK
jgi:hypothetical protein